MRRAKAADGEMETFKRVVEDAEVREESDDAAEDAETEAELEMLQARLDAIRLEEKRALEQARGVEMTPTAERQAMKDAVVGPDVGARADSAEEAERFLSSDPTTSRPRPSRRRRRRRFPLRRRRRRPSWPTSFSKEETSMDELTAELIPTAAEEATIESVEAEAKAIMDDTFNEDAAESDAADDASAMDDAAQYDSSEASAPSPLTEEDEVDDAFAAAAAATKGKMTTSPTRSRSTTRPRWRTTARLVRGGGRLCASAVADDSAQYDSSAVADDSAQYDSSAAAASADDSAQYDSSAVADDSAQYDSSAVADDSARYDSSAAAASADDSAQYDSSGAAASRRRAVRFLLRR